MPDWLRSLFSRNWLLVCIGISAIFVLGAASGSKDSAAPVAGLPQVVAPAALDPGVGSSPLGPPPRGEFPLAKTAEGWVSQLALQYQPIVKVARADRFWPVSVNTVLRLQSGGKTTCMNSVSECPPAPALAALTPIGTPGDFLSYPGKPDNAQGQFEAAMQSLEISTSPGDWITDVNADPYKAAQLYFFQSDNVPKTKRTLPRGLISLQYWFFYPFNYLPVLLNAVLWAVDPETATKLTAGYHEGDFEHVSVLLQRLNKPGRDTYVPRFVYMAQHEGGRLFDWHPDQVELEGTHPIVHVGIGGHASYEHCGVHHRNPGFKLRSSYVGLQDYAICDERSAAETASPRGGVFTFDTDTPLVELKRDSWACWPGRFGRVVKKSGVERRMSKVFRKLGLPDIPAALRKVTDGPEAPLHQFENKGECPRSPNR